MDKREETLNLAQALNTAASRISTLKNLQSLLEDFSSQRRAYIESGDQDENAYEQLCEDMEAIVLMEEHPSRKTICEEFGGVDMIAELLVHSKTIREMKSDKWNAIYSPIMETLDRLISTAEREMAKLLGG